MNENKRIDTPNKNRKVHWRTQDENMRWITTKANKWIKKIQWYTQGNMIAAFKSFKHGIFKTLCLNLQDAFGKRNPMLTASDYNVVRVFFFRLNFPALEPVGDNSHLCEPQNFLT